MAEEWSKKSELNSFNSFKGLLYQDWYKAIRKWKDRELIILPPPVEASLDPIHACNLQCEHCNAASYLISDLKNRRMSNEHMKHLIEFLGEWGVKAVCYGGGGEPTLHSYLPDALYLTKRVGMDVSIATNGTIINKDLRKAIIENCRWIGISIDSATSQTYAIGRKANLFNDVINNVQLLVEEQRRIKTNCDIAYKFLIFEYNQHEIYKACKLAKKIGVKDFHVRPADFSHQGMGKYKRKYNPYDTKKVLRQFKNCHKLEDENFRVFTIVHKFNENFTPRKDFNQCYASPCCIQICADGYVYLCPDQRHVEFYKLGSHYPNPGNILNFWGHKKHYDLVFKTGKDNCKTRCTFAPYCKQVEELFIKDTDPMCKNFI